MVVVVHSCVMVEAPFGEEADPSLPFHPSPQVVPYVDAGDVGDDGDDDGVGAFVHFPVVDEGHSSFVEAFLVGIPLVLQDIQVVLHNMQDEHEGLRNEALDLIEHDRNLHIQVAEDVVEGQGDMGHNDDGVAGLSPVIERAYCMDDSVILHQEIGLFDGLLVTPNIPIVLVVHAEQSDEHWEERVQCLQGDSIVLAIIVDWMHSHFDLEWMMEMCHEK